MQEQLMKYSPDTGEERPYPSNAKQWREYHGRVAWSYNPWTGEKRDLRDIGSDVLGELIVPPRVKPVRQILDDTESWILEAVQSAERLLLGTTVVSYWVKFPLATKVSRKLTREKETLVYVSGNTKTKYYCATENVAILAQSSVVLLDDDKAKTVEQTT